ncbi:MAG: hypothetical protein H6Q90_187 [Deltaproteobacteria bacterium]|nr:hypothetical protein [Deltaproteobacteria bacterium]
MMPPPAPQSAAAHKQAQTARKLINLSTIVGWGGLGSLLLLAPTLGVVLHSATLGGVIAVVGAGGALVGAVVGQIGRAMQGRVI